MRSFRAEHAGIGAAICEVFAREGADVAFNYNSRDDLAEEVKAKIEAHGRRALGYKVSVTDRVGMKHMAREIFDAWGADQCSRQQRRRQ